MITYEGCSVMDLTKQIIFLCRAVFRPTGTTGGPPGGPWRDEVFCRLRRIPKQAGGHREVSLEKHERVREGDYAVICGKFSATSADCFLKPAGEKPVNSLNARMKCDWSA